MGTRPILSPLFVLHRNKRQMPSFALVEYEHNHLLRGNNDRSFAWSRACLDLRLVIIARVGGNIVATSKTRFSAPKLRIVKRK